MFFLYFLVVLSVAFSYTAEIHQLAPSHVQEIMDQGSILFVMFHAPWCSHCKRFGPTLQRIANSFEDHPKILVGKVNCVKYRDFCYDNLVLKYPSFSLFLPDRDKPVIYDGALDAPQIVGFIAYHAKIRTMVAPEIELVTPISYVQFPQYLQDYEHVNVVMLWRDTEDNTEGVNIMRHLAELFLVHPQVQFFYLQYQIGGIPSALEYFRIEHFPTVAVLFRGEVYMYNWETERVFVNFVYEEDDDEEDGDEEDGGLSEEERRRREEEEDEESAQADMEKKLREEGILDLINDIAGTSLNLQGNTVPLLGVYKPLKKFVSEAERFDLQTMKAIDQTISRLPEEVYKFRFLYRKAYKILMSRGTPGIWDEWKLAVNNVRVVTEYGQKTEIDAFKNILRIFAKDVEVEVPDLSIVDEEIQDLIDLSAYEEVEIEL